jgi:hypothetical protein
MKKVLVLSIPHTGTEFVTEYLGFMDIMPLVFIRPAPMFILHPSKHVLYHMHIGSYPGAFRFPDEQGTMEYAKENCKVVIPLRNPIKNAISYINRYKDMSFCKTNWDLLINDVVPNYDIFWLDIDITKERRYNMMNKLNESIERKPINDIEFRKYVNVWHPINHIEQKAPLEGYDFKCLDFAVEWYDNKHTELEKLYE